MKILKWIVRIPLNIIAVCLFIICFIIGAIGRQFQNIVDWAGCNWEL